MHRVASTIKMSARAPTDDAAALANQTHYFVRDLILQEMDKTCCRLCITFVVKVKTLMWIIGVLNITISMFFGETLQYYTLRNLSY